MATTLQDIIAKRNEMGGTATNVDARKALTATTPTAPAPTDINSDANRLARLQASGGSPTAIANLQPTVAPNTPTAPVTPAPMVQAPVDTTTGLSKPLEATVQPTAPTNPAPVTPETIKDVTPGINPTTYAQANAESEKIKAQNEAQMAINKQQSDLRQTETATANATKIAELKQAQDQANSALASNEEAILNTLKTGGIIPEVVKSSPYYQTAQQTYNKLQQYANYSTGDIVTAMNNGSILPGTALYNEMMKDPAMKQKLTDANIYRSGKPTNEVAIYENKSSEILANNPQTSSMFADGLITQEEYAQATNNADIVAKAKDKEEKTNKYNTLYAEYEAVDDKVKAEFPGSPFADAIAADIKKAKYKDVILAKGEMDSAIGTLTDLKAQSASLFETNLKLYESRRAEQQQIAGEQRQVQAQKDMLQYKSDFEKKQAEQALNDPATAIQSVMDEYKKLGIPFTSTVQSRLAEFQNSGLSLPDYLTKMGQNIQQSPAYQQYQKLQQGQLSDREKFQMQTAVENQRDTRNFAQQKELAQFNNDLNRQEFLFKIENDPEQRAKALALENSLASNKSLFDVLGTNVGTYEGNRGYDLAGALGDPLPAGGNWKVVSTDNAGEQVGSIFIGGKGKKPYGNTVVMEDENGNQIRYSHLQNIGVKQGDILGFGDIVGTRGNTGNVKGANGETLTAEQLKAGRGAHLDVEIKSGGKLLSNADQVNFLKGLKATQNTSLSKENLVAVKNARTNLEQDPQYKAYRTLANQVADVKGIQERINSGTASPQDQQQMITAFSKVLDPTSVVRESEFELTKKYGQAGYQAVLQNVSQYWRGDGILNPKSAKILAESLASRYDSIQSEYNSQLQSAKENIEMNIGRSLSNNEFETMTQTRFANSVAQGGAQETTQNDPFGIR